MSNYSFSSVDSATKLLLAYFEINNAIWDHMHDTMQYDDKVTKAMSVVSKYLCDERNALMNKDPQHYVTLDELYEKEVNE